MLLRRQRKLLSASISMVLEFGFISFSNSLPLIKSKVPIKNAFYLHSNSKDCCASHIIRSLLEDGLLGDARKVFDEMPLKNTITWNTLIRGYIKEGVITEARKPFDRMAERTNVTWTKMIGGYSKLGKNRAAFSTFVRMMRSGTKVDQVTLFTVLAACGQLKDLGAVAQIHVLAVKLGCCSSLMLCNTLLDSYSKCGDLNVAKKFFHEMAVKDSVTYNVMATAQSNGGFHREAHELLLEMSRSGFRHAHFTLFSLVTAAVGLWNLVLGQQAHGCIVKGNFFRNVFLSNALLNFYWKNGCVGEVTKLFSELPAVDHVSYNTMISGFASSGQSQESLDLIYEMQSMDFDRKMFPFSSIVSVVADQLNVEMGEQVHAQVILNGVGSCDFVANSLIDMYAKFGKLENAEYLFRDVVVKSTFFWTTMISGYIHNGLHEEALKIFCEMHSSSDSLPDESTLSSVLNAAAGIAVLASGKQLHSYIITSGLSSSVFTASALVDMYAKCGCIDESSRSFCEILDPNIICWNAIISAYARNGQGNAAIACFRGMLRRGHEPDSISFLNLLSACSHSGLISEGLYYFDLMTKLYRIRPKREHYSCMVDMLGRFGLFDQALKLAHQMPFETGQVIWSSILNSCLIHSNQVLSNEAADRLFNMEFKDASCYLTISNIYAKDGRWEDARKMKKLMRSRGVRKESACSWVELQGCIYSFTANNTNHFRIKEMAKVTDFLNVEMKRQSYKPHPTGELHRLEEE